MTPHPLQAASDREGISECSSSHQVERRPGHPRTSQILLLETLRRSIPHRTGVSGIDHRCFRLQESLVDWCWIEPGILALEIWVNRWRVPWSTGPTTGNGLVKPREAPSARRPNTLWWRSVKSKGDPRVSGRRMEGQGWWTKLDQVEVICACSGLPTAATADQGTVSCATELTEPNAVAAFRGLI